MKGRVYYCGMWFGEVYADWLFFGKCWRTITPPCFTKTGATLALKRWIKTHSVYDVKIS